MEVDIWRVVSVVEADVVVVVDCVVREVVVESVAVGPIAVVVSVICVVSTGNKVFHRMQNRKSAPSNVMCNSTEQFVKSVLFAHYNRLTFVRVFRT